MKASQPIFLFCIMLVTLSAWGQSAKKPDTHPVQKDLKKVGKNLQREKRLLQRLQRKSTSLLQTVFEIDRELQSAQEELIKAETGLANLKDGLAANQQQWHQTTQALKECQARLRARLRTLYKMGDSGWMNIIFSSETVSTGMERIRWLQRRARADAILVAETRRLQEQIQISKREIRDQTKQQKGLMEQVEKRRQEAETAKQEKAQALGLLQREEALHTRAISELKRARYRLGKVIANIKSGGSSTAKGFASWRGRLKPPVSGARIDVPFGIQEDQRFKTVTRHQGVDIRAKAGEKIKVVYPGNVVFAEQLRGYGLLVIVDHGSRFFTLYAQLGRLRVKNGDKVTAAQAIGTLGDSGSLKGPYLYFEVRKGGKAVDPQKWVRF